MNPHPLSKYETWLSSSPGDIIDKVSWTRLPGGWLEVFPPQSVMPAWACRVRNFFNVYPLALKSVLKASHEDKLLPGKYRKYVRNRIMQSYNGKAKSAHGKGADLHSSVGPDCSTWDCTKGVAVQNRGLSGEAYIDEKEENVWFQMDEGGAIYHFEGGEEQGSVKTHMLGQQNCPVFKLIHPDSTGGSSEVIIKQWRKDPEPLDCYATFDGYRHSDECLRELEVHNELQLGRQRIAFWDGHYVPVSSHYEVGTTYQGSYNYSENSIVGFANHNEKDVRTHPHSKIKAADFYLDPPRDDYSKPLHDREFPKLDDDGYPLVDQVDMSWWHDDHGNLESSWHLFRQVINKAVGSPESVSSMLVGKLRGSVEAVFGPRGSDSVGISEEVKKLYHEYRFFSSRLGACRILRISGGTGFGGFHKLVTWKHGAWKLLDATDTAACTDELSQAKNNYKMFVDESVHKGNRNWDRAINYWWT